MTEPVLTEEKTPVSIPPSLMLAKPPALMSTPGESSTSGFGPLPVQSSAGNLAVQRAATEPDRITTPEGDSLPTPVIVGWAEPFEISFSPRTTPAGDVRLLVRFLYRGTQTPEKARDQDFTVELLPAPEMPALGVLQDRRLNVRIVNNSNTTLAIDPYGDGKVTYAIDDEVLPPKPNGARDHHIAIYRNNEPGANASFLMTFTSTGGKPVTETGTGTVVPVAPTGTKPAHEPDPERTPDLSANLLMEMAIGRLHDLKIRPLSLLFWEVRLRRDLPTNMSIAGEPGLRMRLRRLVDLLAYLGPVFTTLDVLTREDEYLGGLADVATERVWNIIRLYGEAILTSYYGDSGTNEPLAAADRLMAEFPGWLNRLYLSDPRGVSSLINKIPDLQAELRSAYLLRGEYNEVEHLRERSYQVMKMSSVSWGPVPGSLYGEREQQRQKVEWDWRSEKNYVSDEIHKLYADVQTDIGMLTAMILYEQCSYLAHQLSSSLINDIIETPVGRGPLEHITEEYAISLWHIVHRFEDNSYETDGKEKQATAQAILGDLEGIVGKATSFESDLDAVNSRLKWINRIDFAGKLVLIVAAATLTGGLAGSIAEVFGANWFYMAVATGFGFTVGSRLGQRLAYGKVEGGIDSFIDEWFWNTVTFGVLSKVNAGLANIIKFPEGAGRFTKLAVKLGRAGGAMIALQGVAELHTFLYEHRLMSWGEHGEAMLTNAVLMATLHAGKFITDPIEARIAKGIVDKLRLNKRIADRIDHVAAKKRLALKNRLAELENGEMPPREVDKVIDEIAGAWYEELKIIDDAASGESGEQPVITKSELDTALSAYREHIAEMQLQMSHIGVEAPSPSGQTTFRPIEPGVVAFAPEGRPTLEAFYAEDPTMPGKSLTESATMPGVLEGRMPTGELTLFVPEGETGPIDIVPEPVEPPKVAGPPKPPEPPKPGGSPEPGETKPVPGDPVRDALLKEAEQRVADAEATVRHAQAHANTAKTELEFYEAEAKSDAAKARAKRAEARRLEKEAAARRKNPQRGDPIEAENQAKEANREADRLDMEAKQALGVKRGAAEEAKKAEKSVPVAEKRAKKAGESHERQVELSRRLDALEARYRALPEVAAKPNMKPPTSSEAGTLKWEIDSVKRQLYGEAAKAGVDIYTRLRAASPGRNATKLALKNLQDLPKQLRGPNDNPIDVTTGEEMKPEDISPDHIYPLNSIAQEPGFDSLTPKQQLEIAELTKNYMPLSEAANFSKSGRTMEEWFKTPEGRKVPLKMREMLIEIQEQARTHVQDQIKEMIKQNERSSE